MLSRLYLRGIEQQLTPLLWRARLLSVVHGAAVVGSMLALAAFMAGSIAAGYVDGRSAYIAAGAFMLRVALSWLAQSACRRAGEKAEDIARAQLQWSWQQADNGRQQKLTERANLAVEPVEALYGYFARFLPQLWTALTTPLLILAVAFYLDWIAALFLLFAAPLVPLFMALVGMGAEHLNRQHLSTMQKLAGLFVDRVRGLSTLQLFSATQTAVVDVTEAGENMRAANMKTLRIAFLSSAVLEFFSAVAIAAVAIYVGFALLGFYELGPAASLGFFAGLAILMLAPEYFQPLRTLSAHYHDRAKALAAAEALAEQEEQAKAFANYQLPQKGDGLQLREVSFAYPNSNVVIGQLSLTVHPGALVLLNGASGSGKSTLLRILAGQLAVPNVDQHIAIPCQPHTAYMAQQPFFVQGTIADNLRLVRTDASDHEMQSALNQAGLEKPLQTAVYEQGRGLSGGEQRRLALARMYLNPSPLMLFDEPTAGLDQHTAAQVLRNIVGLKAQGHLLIVASHDPMFETHANLCLANLAGVHHVE